MLSASYSGVSAMRPFRRWAADRWDWLSVPLMVTLLAGGTQAYAAPRAQTPSQMTLQEACQSPSLSDIQSAPGLIAACERLRADELEARAQMGEFVERMFLAASVAIAAWAAFSAQSAAKVAAKNISVARDAAHSARLSAEASALSAGAAKEANAIQLKSIALEHRPRVVIQDIRHRTGLQWSDTEGRLTVEFHLKNVGRTAAHHVDVTAEIHGDFLEDPTSAQRSKAEFARLSAGQGGITLAPGEAYVQGIGLALFREQLAAWAKKKADHYDHEEVEWFCPYLIGGVSYTTHDRLEVFVAGFIRQIIRADDGPLGYSNGFKPSLGDIPAQAIGISRHPFFDGASDQQRHRRPHQ